MQGTESRAKTMGEWYWNAGLEFRTREPGRPRYTPGLGCSTEPAVRQKAIMGPEIFKRKSVSPLV